jgi:hypothetical protein
MIPLYRKKENLPKNSRFVKTKYLSYATTASAV